MDNIVSLMPDRQRPQRHLAVPRSGARILFFTGVRYCREDGPSALCAAEDQRARTSPLRLDATAH